MKLAQTLKPYTRAIKVQDSTITLPLGKGLKVTLKVEGDTEKTKKILKASAKLLTIGIGLAGL